MLKDETKLFDFASMVMAKFGRHSTEGLRYSELFDFMLFSIQKYGGDVSTTEAEAWLTWTSFHHGSGPVMTRDQVTAMLLSLLVH